MRDSAFGYDSPVLFMTDRGLDVPVCVAQQPIGLVVVEAGDDVDDAPRAILQLLGSRAHVHHQVAVSLADPNHRGRRQHVEHHLGRGARLEPRRSGDDLRADRRRNRQIDERLKLGLRIAGHEQDLRAGLARARQRASARIASCRWPIHQ